MIKLKSNIVFNKQNNEKKIFKKAKSNNIFNTFENFLLKTNLNKFKKYKKKIYLLNSKEFNKKLDKFIYLNQLSKFFKSYIIFQRLNFILRLSKLKNKINKKKRKLKKKKLDFYLNLFLLNNSLLLKYRFFKKQIFYLDNNKIPYILYINVRSNNIFVNLICYKNNHFKLIKFWSCGIFKLHCTKRKLKFIIYTFLKEIKKKIKYLFIFSIKINCAKFLHKFLYRNLCKKLFVKTKFIIFDSFKIFNGCRSKKKRRKKHLKFRILR